MANKQETISRSHLSKLIESIIDSNIESNGEATTSLSTVQGEIEVLTKSSVEPEPMIILADSSNIELLLAKVTATSTTSNIEKKDIVNTKQDKNDTLKNLNEYEINFPCEENSGVDEDSSSICNNIQKQMLPTAPLSDNLQVLQYAETSTNQTGTIQIYKLRTVPHKSEQCPIVAPFFIFRKKTDDNDREVVHLSSTRKCNFGKGALTAQSPGSPGCEYKNTSIAQTEPSVENDYKSIKLEVSASFDVTSKSIVHTVAKLKDSITPCHDENVTLVANQTTDNNGNNNSVEL